MEINDILKITRGALEKVLEEKKGTQEMIKALGPAIIAGLKSSIEEMTAGSKVTREEILKAIAEIKIEIPEVKVPDTNVKVEIPDIKMPEVKVEVNVPEIKIPEAKITVNVPKIEIPKKENESTDKILMSILKSMQKDVTIELKIT